MQTGASLDPEVLAPSLNPRVIDTLNGTCQRASLVDLDFMVLPNRPAWAISTAEIRRLCIRADAADASPC